MKKNYITSKKFLHSKISFGFFTRKGGYSSKKFFSLNCSSNNNDDISLVNKNILNAQKQLSLNFKKIKFVNQIHSNKVVIVDNKNFSNNFKADGIITRNKEICIAMLTADCCPIFLFDDESKFIACIHAGWKGAYLNIMQMTVNQINKIQPNFSKVKVIIGPCLNKKNFEVSDDFKKKFIKNNSNYKKFFIYSHRSNKNFFDMRKLIKFQLLSCGLKNIDDINIDTYDNESLFFSHRRSTHLNQLPAGRMINIIGFKNSL